MIYDALFPGQVQVEKDPWIRFKRKHQSHGHLTWFMWKMSICIRTNGIDWDLAVPSSRQQVAPLEYSEYLAWNATNWWDGTPNRFFFARRTFPPRASLAAVIATVKVWDSAGACTYSLEAKLPNWANTIDLAARRVRDAGRSSSYRLFEDWSFSLSLYIYIYSYDHIYVCIYIYRCIHNHASTCCFVAAFHVQVQRWWRR